MQVSCGRACYSVLSPHRHILSMQLWSAKGMLYRCVVYSKVPDCKADAAAVWLDATSEGAAVRYACIPVPLSCDGLATSHLLLGSMFASAKQPPNPATWLLSQKKQAELMQASSVRCSLQRAAALEIFPRELFMFAAYALCASTASTMISTSLVIVIWDSSRARSTPQEEEEQATACWMQGHRTQPR